MSSGELLVVECLDLSMLRRELQSFLNRSDGQECRAMDPITTGQGGRATETDKARSSSSDPHSSPR
ncbi:hypothetical protein HCH54_003388 [Aspergillus fumigatus]